MFRITLVIFSLIFVVRLSDVQAQHRDSLKVDEMEVLKSYRPEIHNAEPIHVSPIIELVQKREKNYAYEVTNIPLQLSIPTSELKPLAMPTDPSVEINRFYAKIGYGTSGTATGDISHQILTPDLLDVNIYGSYRGINSSRSQELLEGQEQHLGKIGAYGSWRLFDNTRLNFDISGGYDDYLMSYKAYTLDKSVVHSSFNFGFQNVDVPGSGINYDVNFGVNYLQDSTQLFDESTFNLEAALSKKISKKLSANVAFDAVYFNRYSNHYEDQHGGGQAFLGIHYNDQNSYAIIGAAIGLNEDILPFPSIELGYNVLSDAIQVYAAVDQEIYDNSAYTNYLAQPYLPALSTSSEMLSTRRNYGVGVRGALSGKVNFTVEGGYETRDNVTTLSWAGQEIMDYSAFYLYGDIVFRPLDILELGAMVQNKFIIDSERAFYTDEVSVVGGVPNHIIEFDGKVDIVKDLLYARLNYKLSTSNEITFFDPLGHLRTFDYSGYNDLNFQVTFKPIEALSIWLKANDLLDNQYEIAPRFQSPGRFFQGGVALKF